MGNEASLEGGGAEGQLPLGPAAGPSTSPGSAKPPSAPGSGGQLPPGRAPAAAPGPAQPHGPSARSLASLPLGYVAIMPACKGTIDSA
uniref:Uncharacterized protein n=1 Tax=Sphaerodactylus townsendi TaxID=933632 RepID=A0ACB8EID5_9SAUR